MARTVFGVSTLLLFAVVIAALTGRAGADLDGPALRIDDPGSVAAAPDAGSPAAVGSPIVPDAPSTPSTSLPADPVASGLAVPPPTRLRIESIGVDDPVVTVGLEGDGSLEIPGPREVGWYRGSVAPGSPNGSAVLTAHVDYDGTPGVFLELARLELGAEIASVDAAGVERRYRVTERYQVDKDDLDVDQLFARDGQPTLTLITCGGAFDERSRHYRDNIVIRATPV